MVAEPPPVALSTALEIKLGAEDVQGPPALWQYYHVKFNPAIPPYDFGESSQRSEYSFLNLRDGGNYRYSVQIEDAFGNRSGTVERGFRVAVPWTRNSRKVGAAVAAASIALIFMAVWVKHHQERAYGPVTTPAEWAKMAICQHGGRPRHRN